MALEILYQVEAPHFTAGMVARGGKIVEAAPILKWAVGRLKGEVLVHMASKRWKFTIITETQL